MLDKPKYFLFLVEYYHYSNIELPLVSNHQDLIEQKGEYH